MIFEKKPDGNNYVGHIDMGFDTVVLEKIYGPTVYAQIRVRAVMEPEFFGYIIERDDARPCDPDPHRWVEVARTPGQKDSDYDCGVNECSICNEDREQP